MNALWCDNPEEQIFQHGSIPVNHNPNEIFNHLFVFANSSGDFPAGWQKYRGSRSAEFLWEEDEKEGFRIRIRNRSAHQMVSICQQRSFAVPVHEKQVWEIGARAKANIPLWLNLKAHYISDSSRVLSSSLDFFLDSENDYYSGLLTIPAHVDYAYIELGSQQAGILSIEDVVFRRVFPIEKYNMDAQSRININTVEVIKKIAEPVEIRGAVEVKGALPNVHITKNVINLHEDLTAEPVLKYSKVQDISQLGIYSFCVINLGQQNALIQVQISPDGINWLDDGPQIQIASNISKALTANYFLRYIRLACVSASHYSTNLSIFFQAQS